MKSKKILIALIVSIFISATMTTSALALSNCVCGSSRTAWCSGYNGPTTWSHIYWKFLLPNTCEYVVSLHPVTVTCNNPYCTEPDVYTQHLNSEIGHDCGQADYWGSCSGGDVSYMF